MRLRGIAPAALAAIAAAACLPALAQATERARVEASYVSDPRGPAGERILQELKRYIERSAPKRLVPGQSLSVELLHVYRAGHRSWTPGNDGVRVITDSSPARIELAFALSDGAGAVLAEGTRSLRNPDYFVADRGGGGDPLRFEKALLDDWLAREFVPRK